MQFGVGVVLAPEQDTRFADEYAAYEWHAHREAVANGTVLVEAMADEVRRTGEISEAARRRFQREEKSWLAEAIDGTHTDTTVYEFDGHDVIVDIPERLYGSYTLGRMLEDGYRASVEDAAKDPRLAFRVRRNEIFLDEYQDVVAMMRGETAHDTIISFSTFPHEILDQPGGEKLLKKFAYKPERRLAFMYMHRRLSGNRLESSVVTLDSSNQKAMADVLSAEGVVMPHHALVSHEYGAQRIRTCTQGQAARAVLLERVARYDTASEDETGEAHYFGRKTQGEDARAFIDHHGDVFKIYQGLNEDLALAKVMGALPRNLGHALAHSIQQYRKAGAAAVSSQDLVAVEQWLIDEGRPSTAVLAAAKNILRYNNATLFKEMYRKTALGEGIRVIDGSDSYASASGETGAQAAGRGDTVDGCDLSVTGQSLQAQATQLMASQSLSRDEALRRLSENAAPKELRDGEMMTCVTCPICRTKGVDAVRKKNYLICAGKKGKRCRLDLRTQKVWGPGEFEKQRWAVSQKTDEVSRTYGEKAGILARFSLRNL